MSKRGFLWKEVEEEKKIIYDHRKEFFLYQSFLYWIGANFFCSDLTLRVYYEFVVISLGFKQLVCDSYNQNLLLLELNYSRLKRGVENDI